MKETYTEQIEEHYSFSRKMRCPVCKNHKYLLIKQLEPECLGMDWFVRCPQCGTEGFPGPSRDIAIARWKQL